MRAYIFLLKVLSSQVALRHMSNNTTPPSAKNILTQNKSFYTQIKIHAMIQKDF